MHPESRINILFLFLLTDSRLGHALLFWGAKATFYYLFIYFGVKEIIISLFNLQSSQVKRAPPPPSQILLMNQLIIWKMNLLVVSKTSVKFKSAFLHA